MPGKILEIYIAEQGATPVFHTKAEAEAGRGLVGDRYYHSAGTFSEKLEGDEKSQITFIAAEEVDRFNQSTGETLDYGDARRNLVTQGIDLAGLIGNEFSIGSARFMGIERCEPCAHLAATVNEKVIPHLVHTGLRAAILTSGIVQVGDKVEL